MNIPKNMYDCVRASNIRAHIGDLEILLMSSDKVWTDRRLIAAFHAITDIQKEVLFAIDEGINDTE